MISGSAATVCGRALDVGEGVLGDQAAQREGVAVGGDPRLLAMVARTWPRSR
jgi:hypothetical protein